jgi:hypothetical protein
MACYPQKASEPSAPDCQMVVMYNFVKGEQWHTAFVKPVVSGGVVIVPILTSLKL